MIENHIATETEQFTDDDVRKFALKLATEKKKLEQELHLSIAGLCRDFQKRTFVSVNSITVNIVNVTNIDDIMPRYECGGITVNLSRF